MRTTPRGTARSFNCMPVRAVAKKTARRVSRAFRRGSARAARETAPDTASVMVVEVFARAVIDTTPAMAALAREAIMVAAMSATSCGPVLIFASAFRADHRLADRDVKSDPVIDALA